jgi:hypothetical protein
MRATSRMIVAASKPASTHGKKNTRNIDRFPAPDDLRLSEPLKVPHCSRSHFTCTPNFPLGSFSAVKRLLTGLRGLRPQRAPPKNARVRARHGVSLAGCRSRSWTGSHFGYGFVAVPKTRVW